MRDRDRLSKEPLLLVIYMYVLYFVNEGTQILFFFLLWCGLKLHYLKYIVILIINSYFGLLNLCHDF